MFPVIWGMVPRVISGTFPEAFASFPKAGFKAYFQQLTKRVNDMTDNTNKDIAQRLRAARDDMGFSRRELAEITNIPQKTIEKFEIGSQEPSVSRLQTLCDVLDVTRSYLIDGYSADNDNGADRNGSKVKSGGNAIACPKCGEMGEFTDEEDTNVVFQILTELDLLRDEKFDGAQRRAIELSKDLIRELGYLEPAELMKVAAARELYLDDCPSAEGIMEIFNSDIEKAQTYCGLVEERILDTAILGIDMYAIEKKTLDRLSDKLEHDHEELEAPGFFGGWGEYSETVPLIRPYVRSLAFSGMGPDFDNPEDFSKRKTTLNR